jgi:hypothetical protein
LGYSESGFHKISIGRQFDRPILCTEKLVPKIEGQQSGFFCFEKVANQFSLFFSK